MDPKTKYIHDLFIKESDLLKDIALSTNKENAHMQIGPDEGQLLFILLKMIKAQKVLEIGTLSGYSSAWMSQALPNNGKIYSIEKSDENYKRACNNIKKHGLNNKIKIIHGAAEEILPTLENKAPFDAVFIDANKNQYPLYFEYASKYLRSGGLLIADNTLLFGTVYAEEKDIPKNIKKMTEGIKSFNFIVSSSNDFESIILPTRDGTMIAVKN